MSNFTTIDDEGLWGSSNDLAGFGTIASTEQCLMQNVKNTTYMLTDNCGDEIQSFEALFPDGITDNLPPTWNPEDFFLEDQKTTSPAQPGPVAALYQCQDTLPHTEWDSAREPVANSSPGPQLQVLCPALPINSQPQESSSNDSDIKTSLQEYDIISSNVAFKFKTLAAGSLNASQVQNAPAVAPQQVLHVVAASSISSKSSQAGKKAPRRRRNNSPKEKLYMRQDPFSDEEEEKKRLNAVKAYNNRQRHSNEINKLKDENQELKRLLQEKNQLLQEKDNQIKAFYETQKQKNMHLIQIKSELSKLIMI